jgi:hypothetical protein
MQNSIVLDQYLLKMCRDFNKKTRYSLIINTLNLILIGLLFVLEKTESTRF